MLNVSQLRRSHNMRVTQLRGRLCINRAHIRNYFARLCGLTWCVAARCVLDGGRVSRKRTVAHMIPCPNGSNQVSSADLSRTST